MSYRHLVAFCISLWLTACAPVMEATRPDPVDLSQFAPGMDRMTVVGELGAPAATLPDGPLACDIYQLYTRGPDAVGKGAIAFGEAATDVLTLGLSEVLWTPIEAGTKNAKHTVAACYGPNGKLVSMKESGAVVTNAPTPVAPLPNAATPAPAMQPSAPAAASLSTAPHTPAARSAAVPDPTDCIAAECPH